MQHSVYLVYKTTNLVNGKIYIGVHKTDDEDNDTYLGSGKYFIRSLEKHGKDNFTREILYRFDNHIDAYDMEKRIVTENFIQYDWNYNIRVGGRGGDAFSGMSNERLTKVKQKMSKSALKRGFTESMKINLSKGHGRSGWNHTEESKEKIRERRKQQITSDATKRKISKVRKGVLTVINLETMERERLTTIEYAVLKKKGTHIAANLAKRLGYITDYDIIKDKTTK